MTYLKIHHPILVFPKFLKCGTFEDVECLYRKQLFGAMLKFIYYYCNKNRLFCSSSLLLQLLHVIVVDILWFGSKVLLSLESFCISCGTFSLTQKSNFCPIIQFLLLNKSNFQFKILFQNWFKKFCLKLNFWSEKEGLEQCAWSRELENHLNSLRKKMAPVLEKCERGSRPHRKTN